MPDWTLSLTLDDWSLTESIWAVTLTIVEPTIGNKGSLLGFLLMLIILIKDLYLHIDKYPSIPRSLDKAFYMGFLIVLYKRSKSSC